jgi:hypothetical protein
MFKFCTLTGEINGREIKYDIETETIWAKDYRINGHPWTIKKGCPNGNGYLVIKIGNKKYRVHRVVYKLYHPEWNIEDISKENKIDHENKNKADNRIINLKNVTQQENCFNTNAKGYYWDKKTKKWRARIMLNGKKTHLGYYEKEEDAKNAYLAAKKIYHVIRQS